MCKAVMIYMSENQTIQHWHTRTQQSIIPQILASADISQRIAILHSSQGSTVIEID